MADRVLAFTLVAALVTITPGVDMALVARHALGSGLPAALRASAGIVSGLVVWALAAAAGIAALLAASSTAFTALKLVGAAYLVYLGIRALIGGKPSQPPRRGAPFRQGLFSNLLNPKMAVFYPTVIPQFVAHDDPLAMPLILAAIHLTMGVVWLPFYAWAVTRLGNFFRSRWVERFTGAVLIGLGVRLALERR